MGARVWDGLKAGVPVRGTDVSGEGRARNRHETPGGSGATAGFQPVSGRDGLRRRERSGNGGTRGGLRHRFRRGEGCRGGLTGGNDRAGDFRQIRPAVDVLTGADEDRGADRRHAIPGDVKGGDVTPAIDQRGQQTQEGIARVLTQGGTGPVMLPALPVPAGRCNFPHAPRMRP